ncbi:MAG: PAS domain S-box protein [Actinomycetota bacterium]
MDLDGEEPQPPPLLADFSTAIFYGAAEGLLLASLDDARFIEVNAAFCRIAGRPREELVGRTGDEAGLWVDPAERDRVDVGPGTDEPVQLLLHLRRGDGDVRVVDWDIRVIEADGQRVLLFTVRDVTEREAAARALAEAERRFRTLVEAIPAVVYLDRLDEQSTNIYTSPQAEEMFGFPMSEWEADPKKWMSLLHPGDRDRILSEHASMVPAPGHLVSEYRMIAKNGRVVWVHDEGVPLDDERGRPAYWQGVWLDITARRTAEAALRESEELYRMVVENATDLVALVDPTGTVVYASPSHASVLGYAPEEIVGDSVFAQASPDTARASRASFARAAAGERTPGVVFRLHHRDGHVVELEGVGWQPLFDEAGEVRYVLTVSRDVSERRRAEEDRRRLLARVVEAQELERQRIAGDVHDDPLQAVTALGLRLQLLRRHVEGDGVELLSKLQVTADRAQASLRALLFELRPPSLDKEGLAAAIREDLRMTGGDLQAEVIDRIAGDLSPERRIVLYRIAREALLNVRKHANATRVWVQLREADGGTLLRVEDDGTGASVEEVEARPRVGLSTMQERAELAGGWLRISPRPEGGTIVACWIPAKADA